MAKLLAAHMPDDLVRDLDGVVRTIIRIANPELVILFGSYAEGTARDDSDVDLLVVDGSGDPAPLGSRLGNAIQPLLGHRQLDLLVVKSADWPGAKGRHGCVTYEANRTGLRLYDRASP